jgi:hypothetical protein
MGSKIRTGRAALAVLILALASGAFPQAKVSGAGAAQLATLDEVAAAGKAASLDYLKARNAAAAAAAAVPALVQAKSSTLAASYAYTGDSASSKGGSGGGASGFSASAAVPLLDQIGLAASVSSDLSATVSASLSPLAHSDARTQATIAYQRALAAEEEAGRSAGDTAVKAALAWMSMSRQLATQERLAALKKDAYDAAKASNAIDPLTTTLDDLVTALQDWSDSRSALIKAQAAERKAETDMYAALGSSRGEVEVSVLGLDALAEALPALEQSLAGAASSGPAESFSAASAGLDVASSRAKLDSIWAFEPDLALSGGLSIAPNGSISPNASVKLTLSLDDLKGVQKAQAKADLDASLKTLALQKSADANAYDQALAAVQAAKLNSESRKTARDQSAELVDVASYSFKSGTYSAIENETAILALASAEDAYYQALADEYGAWLDLAKLAGK